MMMKFFDKAKEAHRNQEKIKMGYAGRVFGGKEGEKIGEKLGEMHDNVRNKATDAVCKHLPRW